VMKPWGWVLLIIKIKRRDGRPVCCWRGGFSGSYVVEEADYQAHMLLRRWVFRPVSILSRWENRWECVHFSLGFLGEGWISRGRSVGNVFPGVRLGGYLDTFEGNWNSWSHNDLRLLIQHVLEP
jgi:hypothetical protein